MQTSKKKKAAFELYRAMAVTMIMVGHFVALSRDLPILSKKIFFSFTTYGLAIFFIISGFLLSASFISLLKKQNQIHSTVKLFFIKRIFRIYPAYLISLIIFTAILTRFFQYPVYWFDLFVHFLNIHNLFEGLSRSMNPVYWTLALEFQWYLFAPLLILIFMKTNLKMLIALFSASILLSMFMRYLAINDYLAGAVTHTEMIRLGYDQLYIHLFNFIIGIIMYKWRRQKVKLPSPAVFLLLLMVPVIGYVQANPNLIFNEETFRNKLLLDYAGILILGIAMFVFKDVEINGKVYRIISFISLVSYSLYIYHFPILHHVINYNFAWYVTFPLFFAVSLFFAAISYYIIEAPFLKISSRMGKEIRKPAISS